MTETIFGLDFGTTNSLAAVVVGNSAQALAGEVDDRPHPSVVWYRGSDIIVGREARNHLDSAEGGVAEGFVRSPKMALRREGPVHVIGRSIEPVDIVAEVLKHIRRNAATHSDGPYNISRAVMTVPVDFKGTQRRALRAAAAKANINVMQFVHEPAAALYAYLRSQQNVSRALGQLENRVVLVFDWGGGTLDLTICRILGGKIFQIKNLGNNDIGGDRFDERIRNEIRNRHATQYDISDITAIEQPGVAARLLAQCEQVKIALSIDDYFPALVKDYLRTQGPERNLSVRLSRSDLEELSKDLVNAGLGAIDHALDEAFLDLRDVELCLATGGMVNMPAIWNGLVERFGRRVPKLPNRDRIIAEGAAWIAHDELRLTLAKPIELEITDQEGGKIFLPLVDAGRVLPVENQVIRAAHRRFFCVDPRDEVAVFKFVKPMKVGLLQESDRRSCLGVLNLSVDPEARPFLERLECEVRIDADYIAHVALKSKGRKEMAAAEFHDLEFGLALLEHGPITNPDVPAGTESGTDDGQTGSKIAGGVSLRSNISDKENWALVPGDIVENWKPNWLVKEWGGSTKFQQYEKMYYEPCTICHRTSYQITNDGPVQHCRDYNCDMATR